MPIEDIRRRAHGHGYAVEEFYLGKDGLTPKNLQKVPHARGIEGVIISPQGMTLPCSKLDYSPFAAVTFGNAMSTPALHMCAGNMTLGIHMAAEQLAARGYKRIRPPECRNFPCSWFSLWVVVSLFIGQTRNCKGPHSARRAGS